MGILNKKFWVYIAVIVAMAFWALSFIWYKDAYVYYRPITLVFFRLVISSAFLYVFSLAMRKLERVEKGDLKLFFLLAFFEPLLYFIGESFGMTLISSTMAAVIVSTIPLLIPIGEFFMFHRRISTTNLMGIIASILGVCMVIFHNGFGQVNVSFTGVALMFLAVFSTVGYSLIVGKLTVKYNVYSIITYQNTIGALYFMPLFLIFDLSHFRTVGISWQAMIPVVKLGIFASTFAFMLFTYSIKHLGITRANTFSNAIPVLTAFFAYFLLDEALTPVMIAGVLVVVAGLFLSQISPKTKTQVELKVLPEHPVVGIGLRLRKKLFRK